MFRNILILAKSNKHGNYCIAGIDINTREWIRPVSSSKILEGAVLIKDATYKNGQEVQVLDVVRIRFREALPTKAQYENILYDNSYCWQKIGKITLEELLLNISPENIDYLFSNTERTLLDHELTGKSLAFVMITSPYLSINTFEDGNRRIQLNFTYNGNCYKYISIGDPEILNEYRNCSDGNYSLGNKRYAVFSLTDKYILNGKYYKMLAKLF